MVWVGHIEKLLSVFRPPSPVFVSLRLPKIFDLFRSFVEEGISDGRETIIESLCTQLELYKSLFVERSTHINKNPHRKDLRHTHFVRCHCPVPRNKDDSFLGFSYSGMSRKTGTPDDTPESSCTLKPTVSVKKSTINRNYRSRSRSFYVSPQCPTTPYLPQSFSD